MNFYRKKPVDGCGIVVSHGSLKPSSKTLDDQDHQRTQQSSVTGALGVHHCTLFSFRPQAASPFTQRKFYPLGSLQVSGWSLLYSEREFHELWKRFMTPSLVAMLLARSSSESFICSKFLLREAIICCLVFVHQPCLSYSGFLSMNPSNRRNYCHNCFTQPRNKRFLTHSQNLHHSSGSHFHHFGHSNKVVSGGTYSILQSSCLQHWFKNWREQRKHKLTASTFGGAVGFWPGRRVQLWLEKLGAIEPFTGNLATCWNNIKEEEALERYKLITGNSVYFPEFQIHGKKNPEDEWLAASPDGVVDQVVYGLPSRGVLEIKCPFFGGNMQKAFPWKRIPLYYIPQAQGLMEILDRDWMDFYVWTPHGSSLFRINRDVEYWNLMKLALSDFWWKHVQPARDLYCKSQITDPLIQMRSLKPTPRHELCGAIVYASKYLVDDSKLLMREIHGKLRN
ncbi:hypothetical protein NE237_001903 [Protea cynaroides]|uniref:YqaJ viral recombinase domain-containing protein n=1 Tax=Protea cynaroides TaxID=273540 RepID=A0A9Q0QYU2_9MAGN|nr:hypothetical protein NE237_001903 [Protea cynaroides]